MTAALLHLSHTAFRGPVYSKIHQRSKHPECTLAAVGNHDSRGAASGIQQVVDMDNSMNLSLEMSWNNPGRFCCLPNLSHSWERVSRRRQRTERE